MSNIKQDFKYPLIAMFFDADDVACTFVEDLVKLYPDLEDKFKEKCWDIEKIKPYKIYYVIAIEDALEIIYDYTEEKE